MSEPLSITCDVLKLVTVALSSAEKLTQALHSLEDHDKRTVALKRELADLAGVLESLRETVVANPGINVDSLKWPLHRCGQACDEFRQLILRLSNHTTSQRRSTRDLVTQSYLWGDTVDFRDMLASYKLAIKVAIANIAISRIAAVTPKALESYRTMAADTKVDLQQHLQDVEAKVDAISTKGRCKAEGPDWQAILDEKECTEKGLEICRQFSAEVDRLGVSAAPQTPGFVTIGIGATKRAVQPTIAQLYEQEESIGSMIESRLDAMKSSQSSSAEERDELERLRAVKQSINQCIQIMSETGSVGAETERRNVFEDITLEERSYSFTVSTVGELVTARRIRLSGGSYNIGGQLSDESFQRAIEALTREGAVPGQGLPRKNAEDAKAWREGKEARGAEFRSRHGRGVALTPAAPAAP